MFKRFIYIALIGALACLALGFAGQFLPLGDSLAVFRLPNILAALFLTLALRRNKIIWPSAALIALGVTSMASHYIPKPVSSAASTYRLYQKNLLFRNADTEPLKDDILQSGRIDFVTFQEVTEGNRAVLDNLKTEFPYQTTCPFASVGGVAIISRWPAIEGSVKCAPKAGMVAMRIAAPSGPLWIVSLHLHWPYPYGQAAHVRRLLPQIDRLDGPIVIAGDFNMVPWSHTVRAISRASQTQNAHPPINSLALPIISLPIPIDHVLVPEGARAQTQRRGKLGSDHYGIIAEFERP